MDLVCHQNVAHTGLLLVTDLHAGYVGQAYLPGLVDYLLELPASVVAQAHVVDLACTHQVSQSQQGLLNGCGLIPAMCLQNTTLLLSTNNKSITPNQHFIQLGEC